MEKQLALLMLAALAVTGMATAGGDAKKDLDLLQGNWKIASIKESDATKNPTDDYIKSMAVSVKGDQMKVMAKADIVVAFRVKLDPSKKPKAVDFTITEGPDKGKTELGIYKIEDDTVTFCTNDLGEKDRPTAFANKEGTKISVVVLKKTK